MKINGIRVDKIQKIDNYALKRDESSKNSSQNNKNKNFNQTLGEKRKEFKRNEKK